MESSDSFVRRLERKLVQNRKKQSSIQSSSSAGLVVAPKWKPMTTEESNLKQDEAPLIELGENLEFGVTETLPSKSDESSDDHSGDRVLMIEDPYHSRSYVSFLNRICSCCPCFPH
eukprot:TRINITY_DN5192_c0_g1_i5.p1 TRINITY_DN5192_c0_g1~~TRINITY_DN5192_c0_g1_i5.p1  ORF type:complete len:116 (-),score=2.44 TRINITY_DN5192_c0_g1_i5:51-398(-)